MNIIELAKQAGFFVVDGEAYSPSNQADHELTRFLQAFAALVAEHERKACLKIIREYQIPVGNSSAGEIACEMTYGALKDIHDDITARGTT